MTNALDAVQKRPADIFLYLVPAIDLRYPAYLIFGHQ
jgi:hypothetical protein